MTFSRPRSRRCLPGFALLACSLLPDAGAAAGPAPVVAVAVAVPYYHTVDLLQMQRRHLHLPAARQFREQAGALYTTLAQGCTDRHRAPARLAWTGTMAAWTRLSAVSTGPLLLRRSTRAIDFQPTRPRLIEQAIDTLRTSGTNSPSGTTPTPPDAAQLERIGSPAKGLPALEWLLWSPAAPHDAAAVCPYAVALASDLVREATAVEAAWQAEETAEEPDEAQQTAAFAELVNQWVGAVEALRWADIERPLRAGRDDKLGWPRQTSGQTALAWRSRWEAIRTLTRTPDVVPQEGAGLVTMALYLRGHGHLRLADTLDAATRQADAALKNLRPQDPPARLQAATRALARLRTLIETDVASAAKVSIGFSDADGD